MNLFVFFLEGRVFFNFPKFAFIVLQIGWWYVDGTLVAAGVKRNHFSALTPPFFGFHRNCFTLSVRCNRITEPQIGSNKTQQQQQKKVVSLAIKMLNESDLKMMNFINYSNMTGY